MLSSVFLVSFLFCTVIVVSIMREISEFIEFPGQIPSVDRLVRDVALQTLVADYGASLVTVCAKLVLKDVRVSLLAGSHIKRVDLYTRVTEKTKSMVYQSLIPVMNLSGTILNTNLGKL